MSVNRRWHRADLVISPLGCFVLAVVVSVIFIVAALAC